MIQSPYESETDCLLSPPAKRQRLSLNDEPLSPYAYCDSSEEVNVCDTSQEFLGSVPFTIKWNQHPEGPAGFPSVPLMPAFPVSPENPPTQTPEEAIPTVRPCGCSFCPKPGPTPFSDLLQSMPLVDTTRVEELLQPFPATLPELSLDTVVSFLNSCAAPSMSIPPRDVSAPPSSSLTVEGPFNDSWYIGGLSTLTPYHEIKSSIDYLLKRCRRDSDINARFTLLLENRFRSTVGEQLKGKLWDITPEKIAVDIFNQISKFSSYLRGEQLFIKIMIYHQEQTVKLLSDGDVKKKRSVITIYEKEEASLIYAFYVALRRNIIVKQKKSTNDSKKKKELENQLTNVYRKGRKSLKKKTQAVLDKSKVVKTVDAQWGFSDIPLLEMKLGVRCVVFSAYGKCLHEGGYEHQDNEIDLLFINNKFHVLASRNVFRNYSPPAPYQFLKTETLIKAEPAD